MTNPWGSASEGTLAGTADEAGTAPGDRRFRPDIEGLRAVAIALVVLYHAGLSALPGGFVGVDVFFVISGFVITGVLLREEKSSGRISMLGFYGRRVRRIIPAATVTIIVTVGLTYVVLGVIAGNQTAIDARWAAVFLANVHLASLSTDYLTARQPPSPLQNFWSLAVEEQFYVVYPTLFIVAATSFRRRLSLPARLAVGLSLTIVASFTLSVIQTSSSPTAAFFSPLTRAWELALGALVAVGTAWLRKVPRPFGSLMTWVGLAAIGFAAVLFNGSDPYPGSLAVVPVVGTALVIAGGVNTPRWAAESLLRLPPFRWLGRLSYSLYLWHWPILILAAEAAGKTSLAFRKNIVWLALALALSVLSYRLVENPVRHAAFLTGRRWVALAMGVVLVVGSIGVLTLQLDVHAASVGPDHATQDARSAKSSGVGGPEQAVVDAVREAARIRVLPADLTPSLAGVFDDWGGPPPPCWPAVGQSSIPACVYGDHWGAHTMVLYGDSHAGMWFDVLDRIAQQSHWKLVYLGKGYCPADILKYENPPGLGQTGGEYAVCDQWHQFAIDRINRIHPDLVILTQETRSKPDGSSYTPVEWRTGLERAFSRLQVPSSRIVVLGNIPNIGQSGPQCLATHKSNVQACSSPLSGNRKNQAEQAAAGFVGARYINVTPWFCSATCTAVVGKDLVFWDQYHVTASYSYFLEDVLAQALHLSGYT